MHLLWIQATHWTDETPLPIIVNRYLPNFHLSKFTVQFEEQSVYFTNNKPSRETFLEPPELHPIKQINFYKLLCLSLSFDLHSRIVAGYTHGLNSLRVIYTHRLCVTDYIVNQINYILCNQPWTSSVNGVKTYPIMAKFKVKL